MDSNQCTQDHTIRCIQCIECYRDEYTYKVQNKLDSAMPWIGMYIAAASAACSLAMAADAFNGFRRKKLWFPCKYFSLNAFSLTVLAVTVKLPVDLTSNTLGRYDKLARVSSLVLMSTAMGNFMTSLGSMGNTEIILNIAALGILVITIAGNVWIHIAQIHNIPDVRAVLAEEVLSPVLMLLLLVNLCSLAIMVPSARRYIESKYNEMHKTVCYKQVEWGKFTIDELRIVVKKHWVMAATGSPQFVIARSAISATSGLLCLLMLLTLVESHVRYRILYVQCDVGSNYKWSIYWIYYIQCIGLALGIIAPLLRWFLAAWFKISERDRKSLRDEFKIENCWTSRLVEWRESSLPLQIRHHNCRKLLLVAKRFFLNICVQVQILFVLASKLVLFISAIFGSVIFLCFHHIKNLEGHDSLCSGSRAETELDFSHYVLLLEGEAKLPKRILKNICNEVDKLIQIGEKKQPKNVIKLLHKSMNFNGVKEFNSNEVPNLHSQEPPNCWSLPVATLTSIAIALPNITTDKANKLLSGVREGLSLVKLVEKTLDRNGEAQSIRNAADKVWDGVELYRKWQDIDLQNTSLKVRTHKETLQNLSNSAEKVVKDFTNEAKDIVMQNPLNWPVKVIAASSMYRVSQTILLSHKDEDHQTDEELFERLYIMISDILAACLTNLVHVITLKLKCSRNDIKERCKSVLEAAVLLGESEEILEILQQLEIPRLDPEKAANIDEWRALMEKDSENSPASVSASSFNSAIPQPNGERAAIEPEG